VIDRTDHREDHNANLSYIGHYLELMGLLNKTRENLPEMD
jgi:hypothetical protein